MRGRRNNRRGRNQNIVQKNVIRCNLHQKPVFSNETCEKYNSKHAGEGENTCKTCKHSF